MRPGRWWREVGRACDRPPWSRSDRGIDRRTRPKRLIGPLPGPIRFCVARLDVVGDVCGDAERRWARLRHSAFALGPPRQPTVSSTCGPLPAQLTVDGVADTRTP